MRVTSKGQVTIPIEIRRKLNITPATEVEFVIDKNGQVILLKSEKQNKENKFEQLRGIATVKMSTEEIMALTRSES